MFSAEGRTDRLVLFDGDQKPAKDFRTRLVYQKRSQEKLRGILKKIAGNIEFSVDGGAAGGDKSQMDTAVRSLVRWVRQYVDYLPGKTLRGVYLG